MRSKGLKPRKVQNKKHTGSYYTPPILAKFIVKYLSKKTYCQSLSILEPSAGDGVFIKELFSAPEITSRIKKVVAIEKNKAELTKARSVTSDSKLITINADFLNFQKNSKLEFDLVIGNPPYIQKKLLQENQVRICESIHASFSALSRNKIKNIWTAFLLRSIQFVNETGILAFVLPTELLQVKFAAELRNLLLDEFQRVEIFTFSQLLFKDSKGQDTVLIIGERKSANKGVFYCNVENINDLESRGFNLSQNVTIKESKWVHHHLNSDELDLLEKLKGQVKTVDEYCKSKTGIVTGANGFFIVTKDFVEEYTLQKFAKPIIQRGIFVNGSASITGLDFQHLIDSNKPTFLIDLNGTRIQKKDRMLNAYLEKGVDLKINERYKAIIRDRWYDVPNVGEPASAYFFKRCSEYPKFIRNDANVLATDSAYAIYMYKNYDLNSLIFSFYNSMTLCFSELNGRYYGGGVLELTPNEFKKLPIPYLSITKSRFKNFISDFKDKNSIKDICKKNDMEIIRNIDPGIDSDVILKLSIIRDKLYKHRIKADYPAL